MKYSNQELYVEGIVIHFSNFGYETLKETQIEMELIEETRSLTAPETLASIYMKTFELELN